ncbi:hypothetical protein CAPTEDRAFT_39461, partial [Capitella teleta]
ERYIQQCTRWYSFGAEDTMSYDAGWREILNGSTHDEPTVGSAFLYHSAEFLNGTSLWGNLAVYSGGGYVAGFRGTFHNTIGLLDDLERNRWTDHFTRVVFVEFSVWNANTNLMSSFALLLE